MFEVRPWHIDVREFVANTEPSETHDTDMLLGAAKECSTSLTSNVCRIIELPPRRFDFAEDKLYFRGDPGSGFRWKGTLGSAFGPVGTWIRNRGANRGTLIHTQGVCQSVFEEIAWDGDFRARYIHHGEFLPENGCGSSGVHFVRCNVFGFGWHGVGSLCGDAGMRWYTVENAQGEFHAGEAVWLPDQHYGVQEGRAVIHAMDGCRLQLKEHLGFLSHPGWELIGCESGARATIREVGPHEGAIGHQFSEAVWDSCHWTGNLHGQPQDWGDPDSSFIGNLRASWACWATLSPSNNKCYAFEGINSMRGSRYGLDWYNASGGFDIARIGAGHIGSEGHGAYVRMGMGGSLKASHLWFENMPRARVMVNINGRCKIDAGYFHCSLPEDRITWYGTGKVAEADWYCPRGDGTAPTPRFMVASGFAAEDILLQSDDADMAGFPLWDGSGNAIGGQAGTDPNLAGLYNVSVERCKVINTATGVHAWFPNVRRDA